MTTIFRRMTLVYLSFTHMVPHHPVLSLLLILEISTFRLTKKYLILDVNIDETKYVLVNIYDAD